MPYARAEQQGNVTVCKMTSAAAWQACLWQMPSQAAKATGSRPYATITLAVLVPLPGGINCNRGLTCCINDTFC